LADAIRYYLFLSREVGGCSVDWWVRNRPNHTPTWLVTSSPRMVGFRGANPSQSRIKARAGWWSHSIGGTPSWVAAGHGASGTSSYTVIWSFRVTSRREGSYCTNGIRGEDESYWGFRPGPFLHVRGGARGKDAKVRPRSPWKAHRRIEFAWSACLPASGSVLGPYCRGLYEIVFPEPIIRCLDAACLEELQSVAKGFFSAPLGWRWRIYGLPDSESVTHGSGPPSQPMRLSGVAVHPAQATQ